MRASFNTILTLCATLLILVADSPEAAELTIDPQRQLQYARELLDHGQYRQAAEAFQRFTFFFPSHADRRAALLEAGKAYMQARDPQSAQVALKTLIADDRLDPVAVEGHFLLAQSYLQSGARSQAVVRLNNLILLSEDIEVEDRAYHRIGWIQMEILDWPGAMRAFSRISADGRQRYNIPAIETALNQREALPQKSPALAGTLSVIPGGGQLYCGRYKDAAVAFVLSVGTTWAALEAFDEDLNVLGSLLALVGVGFYSGNIYGAVNSAHKFNARQERQYLNYLQQEFTRRMDSPSQAANRGMAIAVRISF